MNILVTGGASGLGKAIVEALSIDVGNKVYFTYCHSHEDALGLEQKFKNCKGLYCNFQDKDSVEALLSQMESFDLQVLINNATTALSKEYFHKTSPDIFEQGFKENVLPVIAITQRAISIFRKEKFGKIITILSSSLINRPPLGMSAYVAHKAYLASLSKSWAVENIAFGITSNCVSPSFMDTQLNSETDSRVVEDMIAKHPLKRLVTIEEIAQVVCFLVNCTQHINGVNIPVNFAENID